VNPKPILDILEDPTEARLQSRGISAALGAGAFSFAVLAGEHPYPSDGSDTSLILRTATSIDIPK
jgi:hypothetical protein